MAKKFNGSETRECSPGCVHLIYPQQAYTRHECESALIVAAVVRQLWPKRGCFVLCRPPRALRKVPR